MLGLRAGNVGLRFLQPLRIYVCDGNEFRAGQLIASRAIALPRSPYPITPRRMRSFAPSTLAGTAARLLRLPAIWPRNARRELMGTSESYGKCSTGGCTPANSGSLSHKAPLRLLAVFMDMCRFTHVTAMIRHGTGHMLKLDGRVINAEAAKDLIQAIQDEVAFRGRHILDQHMGTERVRFRAQAPYMEIVDFEYAGNAAHRVSDLVKYMPRGRPSSRILSDSRVISQALYTIRRPMATERIGST